MFAKSNVATNLEGKRQIQGTRGACKHACMHRIWHYAVESFYTQRSGWPYEVAAWWALASEDDDGIRLRQTGRQTGMRDTERPAEVTCSTCIHACASYVERSLYCSNMEDIKTQKMLHNKSTVERAYGALCRGSGWRTALSSTALIPGCHRYKFWGLGFGTTHLDTAGQ